MLTLSGDEIAQLTARVRKSSQCDILTKLGIPYKIRPDGSPVVLRAAMEVSLGYAPKTKGSSSPKLRL